MRVIEPTYKYFAFISYSRKDSRAAQWLQNRLEWFPFPVKLVPKESRPFHRKYIRPIYRDKTNLDVKPGHYWNDISAALDQSRFLIVLCSPDSAKSPSVDLEVSHFLEKPSRVNALDCVLPVVLAGNIRTGDCLSPRLRENGDSFRDRNLPTMFPEGLETESEAWDRAFVEVAAYLLGLERASISDHWQREERKRAARFRMAMAVFALIAVIAVCFGVYAQAQKQEATHQGIIAEVQRSVAEKRRAEAEAERQRAEEQSRRSEAGRLVAEANSALPEFPQRALLLMVEALNIHQHRGEIPPSFVSEALWDIFNDVGGFSLGASGRELNCLATSSDGVFLAAGASDGAVRLWNLAAAPPREDPPYLVEDEKGVTALAIGAGRQLLFAGDAGGNVIYWRLGGSDRRGRLLRGHSSWINVAQFSPDDRWLGTASDDGKASLWDMSGDEGGIRTVLLSGHNGPVNALQFSPDSQRIVTAGEDGGVRVWKFSESNSPPKIEWELEPHSKRVDAVAISPSGSWLATGSDDGIAKLWRLGTTRPSAAVLREHTGPVTCLLFTPDERWMITGGNDGTVKLWDLRAENLVSSSATLAGHAAGYTTSTNASPARMSRLHQLHLSGALKQRDEENHERRRQLNSLNSRLIALGFKPPSAPRSLRIRNDDYVDVPFGGITSLVATTNGWLFSAGSDGALIRWDLNAGDIPLSKQVFRGHESHISAISLGPREECLVSIAWDGNIRVWVIPGKPVPPFLSSYVQLLRTAGSQPRPPVWVENLIELARQTCGRNFTKAEWERFFKGQLYRKTFPALPAPP